MKTYTLKHLYFYLCYICFMSKELTPKQLEILNLLAEGYSTKEVARKLENSDKTIETMRNNMLLRVGAKNIAHLITIAFRNGWIQ